MKLLLFYKKNNKFINFNLIIINLFLTKNNFIFK